MAAGGIDTIKKRSEFLAIAATGKKWVARGLLLQVGPQKDAPGKIPRFGLTASKKVGGAVVRNSARRRMRELAKEIFPLHADPKYDYVLIARVDIGLRSYSDLRRDIISGLKKFKVWKN
ncbi:MAG: ribonuclease P protein component [Alphaproteobacteria bacterium]|nr:ribonuclease P protein component [Alphaproteobacteria bacterium]